MYIRTSNHEILNVIEKKVSNFLGGFWYVCKNHNPKEIHSDFVIKQSESLEELCDCFKTVSDYAGQLIITHYFDFEQAIFNMSDEAELYGYIYIILSNGAVRIEPIAKMNDKGELELI